jgi:hypothetical protein
MHSWGRPLDDAVLAALAAPRKVGMVASKLADKPVVDSFVHTGSPGGSTYTHDHTSSSSDSSSSGGGGCGGGTP